MMESHSGIPSLLFGPLAATQDGPPIRDDDSADEANPRLSGKVRADDGSYRVTTWEEVVQWVKEWDRME